MDRSVLNKKQEDPLRGHWNKSGQKYWSPNSAEQVQKKKERHDRLL